MRQGVDEAQKRLAAVAQHEQREGKQNGEEQDLQDIAFGKGPDDRIRDHVQEKFDRALLPGLRGVDLDGLGIDRLRIDIHPDAGLQHIDDDEPDNERQRGDHLEIDQRLKAYPADLLQILHAGDAMHDRAEDDRRDQHLDQLDEAIAQRLHLLAQLRIKMAKQDAENDSGQYLGIK